MRWHELAVPEPHLDQAALLSVWILCTVNNADWMRWR